MNRGAGITHLRCVYLKPVVRARKLTTKAIEDQETLDEEQEELSGEKTFSTKNATIGEDAKSVTSQPGQDAKDSSKTGNDGEETATGAAPASDQAPVSDNKTQEEEAKEKPTAAEDEQAGRPKSQNSRKSQEQATAAERRSVGGGSKAEEAQERDEDLDRAEEGEDGALPPGMVEVPIYMNKVSWEYFISRFCCCR